ncbi:MAG: hypothetical protein AAF921_00515 [Cyanobacteria bacterium P01_D01_bin.44]
MVLLLPTRVQAPKKLIPVLLPVLPLLKTPVLPLLKTPVLPLLKTPVLLTPVLVVKSSQ